MSIATRADASFANGSQREGIEPLAKINATIALYLFFILRRTWRGTYDLLIEKH